MVLTRSQLKQKEEKKSTPARKKRGRPAKKSRTTEPLAAEPPVPEPSAVKSPAPESPAPGPPAPESPAPEPPAPELPSNLCVAEPLVLGPAYNFASAKHVSPLPPPAPPLNTPVTPRTPETPAIVEQRLFPETALRQVNPVAVNPAIADATAAWVVDLVDKSAEQMKIMFNDKLVAPFRGNTLGELTGTGTSFGPFVSDAEKEFARSLGGGVDFSDDPFFFGHFSPGDRFNGRDFNKSIEWDSMKKDMKAYVSGVRDMATKHGKSFAELDFDECADQLKRQGNGNISSFLDPDAVRFWLIDGDKRVRSDVVLSPSIKTALFMTQQLLCAFGMRYGSRERSFYLAGFRELRQCDMEHFAQRSSSADPTSRVLYSVRRVGFNGLAIKIPVREVRVILSEVKPSVDRVRRMVCDFWSDRKKRGRNLSGVRCSGRNNRDRGSPTDHNRKPPADRSRSRSPGRYRPLPAHHGKGRFI